MPDTNHMSQQLPSHMRAHEILRVATPRPINLDDGEDFWQVTLDRAKRTGLVDSVREHGVQQPVELENAEGGGYDIYEGHHRIAAAQHLEESEGRKIPIPVRVHDRPSSSQWD